MKHFSDALSNGMGRRRGFYAAWDLFRRLYFVLIAVWLPLILLPNRLVGVATVQLLSPLLVHPLPPSLPPSLHHSLLPSPLTPLFSFPPLLPTSLPPSPILSSITLSLPPLSPLSIAFLLSPLTSPQLALLLFEIVMLVVHCLSKPYEKKWINIVEALILLDLFVATAAILQSSDRYITQGLIVLLVLLPYLYAVPMTGFLLGRYVW